MNVWRLLPWKRMASRAAVRHGFVDPIRLFDRIREFAQPSEVGEPVELLRAGAAFHARGLINRAIQFNLDWVWPYWIERQFNPADDSFIPRAFSFSHINLTHRNWTAAGLPDFAHYPIVDPRGLVTPLFDGWSIDIWVLDHLDRPVLLPSRTNHCEQKLLIRDPVAVETRVSDPKLGISLVTSVTLEPTSNGTCPECVVRGGVTAPEGFRFAVALRPFNPEGISFIDSIEWLGNPRTLRLNQVDTVQFNSAPERIAMSCYGSGDVLPILQKQQSAESIRCRVGMATALALFRTEVPIEIRVPVHRGGSNAPGEGSSRNGNGGPAHLSNTVNIAPSHAGTSHTLGSEMAGYAQLEIPNALWKQLYDQAVATVILHAPDEVYPGPYTYRRFWYRDAAFILNALASIGGHLRCRRVLDRFPAGQSHNGYFCSQEGEWDSNGEVLWILHRCAELGGYELEDAWLDRIQRAARWILDKRMGPGTTFPGLLPAGFSAEHLGLNDFYFWDDFWGVAGLRAAAHLLRTRRVEAAKSFEEAASEFLHTIEKYISQSESNSAIGAIPAAPGRRMDSGAVGSLVAGYPLQLLKPDDLRIRKTAEWLMQKSFFAGGFFQDMIHSGINAYLTLHVAQVLLRAGDVRSLSLIGAVADLASSTGQWPEAIHPRTRGGCMGDGQHVWAAAEWIMAIRNLFVREEGSGLVIGAGLFPELLGSGRVRFGPAATPWGELTVTATRSGAEVLLELEAHWRSQEPPLSFAVPGLKLAKREANTIVLKQ